MRERVRLAVDFGTSSTCAALSVDGAEPSVVLVDGRPLVPSAVFVAVDGTVFVGREAERQAAIDPARFEPHPKRRMDEGELLLGNVVVPVVRAVAAVLALVVAEARRVAGGAQVDVLVLTHPANWGSVRLGALGQAAAGLAHRIALVPEPVAAAMFYAASTGSTGVLAVLDIGGGTVDASVVRGFEVLATRGDPGFGGADIDQALLEHVGTLVSGEDPEAWQRLVEGRELPDRRRRRVLHEDVRSAKETLSRHAYTDIPMPPPFTDAHVPRVELERLVHGRLARAVELLTATVRDSGVQVAGVFLVGGSSRIPLLARLAHERLGMAPTALDQPETVVARGALRAVPAAPEPVPVPRPALPPPVRRRSKAVFAVVAVLVVAAAVITGFVVFGGSGGKELAQYNYRFRVPDGWEHSGGDATNRKVQLRRTVSPDTDDVIGVEQRPLSYNATLEPERALGELRRVVEARAAEGYTGFAPSARFAGREVAQYRRELRGSVVEWHVVFEGPMQLTVGCQSTPGGREAVGRACEHVVRTLAGTG
ncbi:type VII secretion-associated protein [Allokutzneria sp. A3M-2-11 16]|uniref:type VII secretion-associated protein n=1 Tax=Allokutzneria sp. A3M-2-11 16 TaxID=2962043 RepID=UPI0020B6D18F|nr:type VII secretion-associated protein [Allokutzneria sp. A3M-2-11 16]MCP3798850.1 type VII secretion-associated protein [Allokutzneria sp. A3M-2-11 16]